MPHSQHFSIAKYFLNLYVLVVKSHFLLILFIDLILLSLAILSLRPIHLVNIFNDATFIYFKVNYIVILYFNLLLVLLYLFILRLLSFVGN